MKSLDHLAAFADATIPRPRQRELARVERRAAKTSKILTDRERDEDKRRRDKDVLRRGYRRWKREQRQSLLAGPWASDVRDLRRLLARLKLDGGDALVAFFEPDPFANADADTRFIVLGLVAQSIIRVRLKAGLPFADDSLWGEPPTAFEQIREILK